MPDDLSSSTSPSNTALLIHGLYAHACEHQEILLSLAKSTSAIRSILLETVDGFEEKYRTRVESEKDDEFFRLLGEQLQAMKNTMKLLRESFGFRPDDTVAPEHGQDR
jgi:hypothetical protein